MAVVAAVGGAAALVGLLNIPVCPTARILRVPCPGCGLSRATNAILHGQLHEAWHLHPLVFFIVPAFAGYMLGQALVYVWPQLGWLRRALSSKWADRGLIVLMVLAVGLWAVRFFGAFGGPVPV
ncbi:MAG: DUF2752 domain-containing protein [Deltaproteobacteria bacterium]|nr:DUF2752 domain-containing protein [Deltaproteobacteria bacterium]